jgi:hypothetical protein
MIYLLFESVLLEFGLFFVINTFSTSRLGPYAHSITEKSRSSTYLKWCGNLQANHYSHPSLSYF